MVVSPKDRSSEDAGVVDGGWQNTGGDVAVKHQRSSNNHKHSPQLLGVLIIRDGAQFVQTRPLSAAPDVESRFLLLGGSLASAASVLTKNCLQLSMASLFMSSSSRLLA